MSGFRQKLSQRILKKQSFLCPGVDPHPDHWPPCWSLSGTGTRSTFTGMVEEWGSSMIAASRNSPAIKFQSAFFEAEGPEGISVLQKLIRRARDAGLFVILDAKRGDISSTMAAYGKMAFEYMDADALTVLPYMGLDSATALLPWLGKGKGIYLVWVSSNPSGQAVQSWGSPPLADGLLSHINAWCRQHETFDSVGLVLGATRIDSLRTELLAEAGKFPLLMPGLGAQGADPDHSRLAGLLRNNCSLLPLSRSLSGVGSRNRDPAWDRLKTTAEYTGHVLSLIAKEEKVFAKGIPG